jgi:hypothetical protein
MAELEIHHETEGEHDPVGQKVGVLAAVLAVLLAVVTILSHRAHTEGVLLKTEANDLWAFYQSKRIKFHSLELGEQLVSVLGPNNPGAPKAIESFRKEQVRYTQESKEAMAQAKEKAAESGLVEQRALRYDVGEGLLEIALVLSSLYFISRKMLFPVIGVIAGLAGTAVAVMGFVVH